MHTMSCSLRSPTISSPKPVNIFYIWYGELCRRTSATPLAIVKPAKPKNETVLDFTADRVKAEEWNPILTALRQDTSLHVIAIRSRVECKFLDDVDTERKAREMKRKGGSLHTNYILKSLVSALTCVIKRSQVITCLELDGLPITTEYIAPLLEALSKNKTIKVLSLRHCPIRDSGCQQLCMSLRYIPNIEILNLTACGLGSLSAQYIAKVIRYQQINRYCESWHSSLRYEDPDIGIMTGLKRITLNNNPNIGDEGLTHILNELDDDLWIKALDMQKCNITDNISTRLIDVIDYSKSLEVADFRNNEMLSINTIEKILDILRNKQKFGYESEYQWCLTATTLPFESPLQATATSCASSIVTNNMQKSKSAPFKQVTKRGSSSSLAIRRIKTFSAIPKSKEIISTKNMASIKRSVATINRQIEDNISTEREVIADNAQSSKKYQPIKSDVNKSNDIKEKIVKFDITTNDNLTRTKEYLDIKIPYSGSIHQHDNRKEDNIKLKEGESKKSITSSKVEFVFTVDESKEKNVAQSLFQNLMYENEDAESDSESEQDMLDYFRNEHIMPNIVEEIESESASNVSLLKFMEEIKSSTNFDHINYTKQAKSVNKWQDTNSTQNCNGSQMQKILVKVR